MPRQKRPDSSFSGRTCWTTNRSNQNGRLSTISAEYSEEYSVFMSYSGRYRIGEGDSDQAILPHYCQAACLQSATCNVYNYNATEGICTRFTLPCPETNNDPIMEFVVSHRGPMKSVLMFNVHPLLMLSINFGNFGPCFDQSYFLCVQLEK